MPQTSRYVVAEATNLMTKVPTKTYKVYEREGNAVKAPVTVALETREEAEEILHELERLEGTKP